MAKEKILVTVKTYPTLSRKYGETVLLPRLPLGRLENSIGVRLIIRGRWSPQITACPRG